MALADLYNIPHSEGDFNVFSFHNQDQHRQIINAILTTKNITLPLFPIDPIPIGNVEGWAVLHQQLHSSFAQILGIVGSDFTSLNLNDPGELSAWIFLHAAEHVQAANMLGLS